MAKTTWRLLSDYQINDCYMNMGIDNAILNALSKQEAKNTIRFYRWKPSAVSIGYFQSLKNVVNLLNCQELEIDYVRRITGGGAVYHDYEGELTYSVLYREDSSNMPEEITKIYEKICGGIIDGLSKLGVNATFAPINDIVLATNKKKISGSALTRKKEVVLQHGTILRKLNVRKMFSVLIIPDEKIKHKMIKKAEERVSSLEKILGKAPSFSEIQKNIQEGIAKRIDVNIRSERLSSEEAQEAKKIAQKKFMSKEWLFKR